MGVMMGEVDWPNGVLFSSAASRTCFNYIILFYLFD